MAFSEFVQKQIEEEATRFLEKRRPPASIRGQVDLCFKIEKQSIILFEIRPRWDKPSIKLELPFAKATYSKAGRLWKVYWRQSDGEWHPYAPAPETTQLADFFRIVDEDEHACFWG